MIFKHQNCNFEVDHTKISNLDYFKTRTNFFDVDSSNNDVIDFSSSDLKEVRAYANYLNSKSFCYQSDSKISDITSFFTFGMMLNDTQYCNHLFSCILMWSDDFQDNVDDFKFHLIETHKFLDMLIECKNYEVADVDESFCLSLRSGLRETIEAFELKKNELQRYKDEICSMLNQSKYKTYIESIKLDYFGVLICLNLQGNDEIEREIDLYIDPKIKKHDKFKYYIRLSTPT